MEKELTDEDPLAVGLGFFFGLIIGGLIGLLCGKLCIKDYARSKVSRLLVLKAHSHCAFFCFFCFLFFFVIASAILLMATNGQKKLNEPLLASTIKWPLNSFRNQAPYIINVHWTQI